MFRLLKMLLNLVLFCCFLCVFLIRERFVLPKFVFHHEFGLYCFCCALSRSCRYHSKFKRFKLICFLVLFVLVIEMHHSILLENGLIFPEDRRLRCQAFYLVEYLVKTECIKRKKDGSEEVINVRVGWEKGKNESEEEKGKISQKKRKITQKKESRERKLVNFPNEEGVGVVHPLMEKPEERSGGVQDGVPFSFLFEGSDMRVEGEEKEEGDAMEIKTNKEFAKTTQARRESEGGKSVI